MQILVKTLAGTTITVDAEASDTIADIKNKVHDEECMTLDGRELDDDKTLEHYNIQNQSVLDLNIRTMEIFIVAPSGLKITMQVARSQTVRNLKEMIQESEWVPAKRQRLVFYGTELDDAHTLMHYGIEKKDILFLRGGMLIFVQTIAGKHVSLPMVKSDTIDRLKSMIREEDYMDPRLQRVVFESNDLYQGTLGDYNIRDFTTIRHHGRLLSCRDCSQHKSCH